MICPSLGIVKSTARPAISAQHIFLIRSDSVEELFAEEYRDQADGYIPQRRSLIEITQSLYRHLIKNSRPSRILDRAAETA